ELLAHLVTARKGKGVPIQVFKPSEGTAPRWYMWRMIKANPAFAPFMELGSDVLGHKNDVPAPTNELVFFGVGLRRNEAKDRGAIRRSNRYPAFAGFHAAINDQIEPKLVHVES